MKFSLRHIIIIINEHINILGTVRELCPLKYLIVGCYSEIDWTETEPSYRKDAGVGIIRREMETKGLIILKRTMLF